MYLFYLLILPICLFISGIGCMFASTKNPNKVFGYRTRNSLVNENNWENANQRFGVLALRLSIVMCMGNMIFYALGLHYDCLKGLTLLTTLIDLLIFILPILIVEDEIEKNSKNLNNIN